MNTNTIVYSIYTGDTLKVHGKNKIINSFRLSVKKVKGKSHLFVNSITLINVKGEYERFFMNDPIEFDEFIDLYCSPSSKVLLTEKHVVNSKTW